MLSLCFKDKGIWIEFANKPNSTLSVGRFFVVFCSLKTCAVIREDVSFPKVSEFREC